MTRDPGIGSGRLVQEPEHRDPLHFQPFGFDAPSLTGFVQETARLLQIPAPTEEMGTKHQETSTAAGLGEAEFQRRLLLAPGIEELGPQRLQRGIGRMGTRVHGEGVEGSVPFTPVVQGPGAGVGRLGRHPLTSQRRGGTIDEREVAEAASHDQHVDPRGDRDRRLREPAGALEGDRGLPADEVQQGIGGEKERRQALLSRDHGLFESSDLPPCAIEFGEGNRDEGGQQSMGRTRRQRLGNA